MTMFYVKIYTKGRVTNFYVSSSSSILIIITESRRGGCIKNNNCNCTFTLFGDHIGGMFALKGFLNLISHFLGEFQTPSPSPRLEIIIFEQSPRAKRSWLDARCHHVRDGWFGSKVGQIGPKWDKSGAFLDQI